MLISQFVKQKRSSSGLSQREMADKAGVGLRFIRDLEQGKETLRMDKVNQVLKLFGYELGPVAWERNEIVERADAKDASEGAVIRKVRKG